MSYSMQYKDNHMLNYMYINITNLKDTYIYSKYGVLTVQVQEKNINYRRHKTIT